MNTQKYKALIAFALLLLIGCENSKKMAVSSLQAILNQQSTHFVHDFTQKKMLLIIPRSGCSGCIGIADNFFKNKAYQASDIQFVFTKISSLKTTRIRLGKERLNQPEVYLDVKNHFSGKALDTMYPIICFLENGQIKSLDYLNPTNKAVLNNL